jgi:methionyl-tRNA synthetase
LPRSCGFDFNAEFDDVHLHFSDRLNRVYVCARVRVELDYSDERAVECINTDLVNTLCNLVSRCAAKSVNRDQIFPHFDPKVFDRLATDAEKDIMTNLYRLRGE